MITFEVFISDASLKLYDIPMTIRCVTRHCANYVMSSSCEVHEPEARTDGSGTNESRRRTADLSRLRRLDRR